MPPTPAQFANLRFLLNRYGLLPLYDRAVEWMVSGIADSPERLEQELRSTPEFRTRFRGMIDREEAGMPPISIDEYLSYEDQAFQLMRSYGYPPGFYDEPDDFANLIAANVSVVELEQRLAGYAEVATLGRETVRQQLAQHIGETEGTATGDLLATGDLAAWFADPERGLQAIRARVRAAGVSASAVQAGFGALSAEEGLRVGNVLDENGALQAFAEVQRRRELLEAQAGETESLGRGVAVGAVAGAAASQQAIDRKAAQRRGQFQRGGSYAESQEGIAGVGSS
jgi:hypothetical protein